MTINEQDRKSLEACCKGNREAMEFLALWSDYVNLVDDLVDEELSSDEWRVTSDKRESDGAQRSARPTSAIIRGAERLCGMGAAAIALYSHPFYLKNLPALRQIALNCTNAYMDSVRFEKSSQAWQREWADHYRHFGSEMVIAVAGICGGYQQMRAVSETIRVICWQSHHDEKGQVV
jgi:hypothetical protein